MLHKKQTILGILLLSLFILVLPEAVFAASVTEKDMKVAVRAFGFTYDLPKGDLQIEIVYNPDVPVSKANAEELKAILGSGFKVGRRVLTGKLVTVSQMGSTGNRLAYVTAGLDKDFDQVFETATQKQLLTFTTDFNCVVAQKCVMGVSATPNIRIEVSRLATEASQLEFSQALKLMIREVD